MFKQISFVTIFLLATFNAVLSQDLMKDYPGIPIVTYSYDILKYYPNYNLEYHLRNMDSAGIFAIEVANMKSDYYTPLNLTNLKIIPDQAEGVTNNYINRYTEAHYSVWEAEGTDPADGDASVYYNDTIAAINTEGNAVVTKTNMGVQDKKLIYGPYYLQENTYCMVDDGTKIDYQADFIIKKETIGQPPNQNDTMCVLQVTTSHKKVTSFDFDSVYVIKDTAIIYSDLADTYKTFSLQYKLTTVPDSFLAKKIEMKQDSFYRGFTDYVEFRVIWKGNSNSVRLYVDKIILSDGRGRFIKDSLTFLIAQQQIYEQMDEFQNRVVGWMGIDEPQTIDNYEPIRIVQGIIDSKSNGAKGLWIAFGGGWSGRWDNYANPWGTYRLSYFEEFYKRVKKANIWCSKYLYDVSYPPSVDNYREKNISAMADSNYRHFQNKENVFWGAAIQTGEYSSDTSWITMREIDGTDLLYNINIALLYGAKVITPWLYFGRGPVQLDL